MPQCLCDQIDNSSVDKLTENTFNNSNCMPYIYINKLSKCQIIIKELNLLIATHILQGHKCNASNQPLHILLL